MQKVITISIPRGDFLDNFPFQDGAPAPKSGAGSMEIEKLLEEGYQVVNIISSDGDAEVFLTFFLEKESSC